MRVAVLSSFTIDGIKKYDHEWYISKYTSWMEDVLNKDSKLQKFNPEVILLSMDEENFDLIFRYINSISEHFPNSQIFVHNLSHRKGLFKFLVEENLEHLTQRASLYHRTQELDNTDVLDVQDVVNKLGEEAFDPRYFYLAKMYYSQKALDMLADQLETAINIKFGKRKKCLVLDLDNTLWGGLLADGVDNLKLADDGYGKAFFDFQSKILELSQSGVILAICSKNDEEQALDVINNHPYMVLREENFAAWRINWQEKHQNIIELAEELNIRRDSFVFLDDSNFEIESVQAVCPEVTCVLLPDDPAYYTRTLCDLPYFDIFELTDEDRNRNNMYVQERSRADIKNQSDSYDDFLKQLNIQVIIAKGDRMTLNRISQLTQRTNQFNFTGEQFSVKELQEKDHVFCIVYKDRIGTQGIIGAAIIHKGVMENFVMSCRVLGRGVEELFYMEICDNLNPEVKIIDTGKNKAAQNFIEKDKEYPKWITKQSSELSKNV